MYILFGDSGNVEAAIPHGQQVRQGNNVDIYVCFPYEDKYKTAKPILSYNKGTEWIDMQNIVPSSDSPYPFVFTRDYVDEAIFGFELNKTYLCYHFSVIRETGFTEKFGIVQLQIRVSDENGEYNFLGTVNVNVVKTYGNSSTGVSMSNYLNLSKKVESIQDSLEGAAFLANDNVFLGTNTFKKHIEIDEKYDFSVLDLTKAKFYDDGIRLEYGSSIYFVAFPSHKAGTFALEEDIPSIEGLAKTEYVDAQDEAVLDRAKEYTDVKISGIDHSAYAKLSGDNTFTGVNTFDNDVHFADIKSVANIYFSDTSRLTLRGLYSDSGNLFYPTFTIRGDSDGAYFAYAYQSDDADLTLYAKKDYVNGTFATKASLSDYVTDTALKTALQPYVTTSSLNTKLTSYSTISYVDEKDTATLNSAKEYTDEKIGGIDYSDFASKSKANVFASDNTFNKNVVVKGDMTVNGTFTKVSVETLSTKEYTIGLAKGNTKPIASYVGMYAEKYDGSTDGALVWDNTGTAYVGDVTVDENGKIADGSNLQPLLTREEATDLTDKAVLFWNADGSKATQGEDGSGNVYTADYLGSLAKKSDVADCVRYANNTAEVAGKEKTVSKVSPSTLFVPSGLIMGGSAQEAGLVTRGICGSSVPNATTGACTKDTLYLNYDGDNTYSRDVALGGDGGEKITIATAKSTNPANPMGKTHSAIRGDQMVNYVRDYVSNATSGLATKASLADYVTNTALKTALQPYVTTSSLNTKLTSYATISYVDEKDGTTLNNAKEYTDTKFDSIDLTPYVTTETLTDTLGDYVTSADLTKRLGGYVTNASLTTTLSSYAKTADVDTKDTATLNSAKGYTDSKLATCLRTTGAQTATGVKSFTDGINVDTINSKTTGNSLLRMYYEPDTKVYRVVVGSVLRPTTILGSGTRPHYANDGDDFDGKEIALMSDIPDTSNLATKTELNAKQNKLVSGTNIKTLNGISLLGEGNITISTGSSIPPVGSMLGYLDDTEPASLYPNTTWEEIEEGRAIVGAGATYKAGSTGGSATHTHSLDGLNSCANIGLSNDGRLICSTNIHQGSAQVDGVSINTNDTNTIQTVQGWQIGHTATLEGSSKESSSLSPYVAYHVWVRTA